MIAILSVDAMDKLNLSLNASGHEARVGNCGVEIDVVGFALPSDVERGAVIDRRAINRQAERNIHSCIERDQLGRNMALIVILRDD